MESRTSSTVAHIIIMCHTYHLRWSLQQSLEHIRPITQASMQCSWFFYEGLLELLKTSRAEKSNLKREWKRIEGHCFLVMSTYRRDSSLLPFEKKKNTELFQNLQWLYAANQRVLAEKQREKRKIWSLRAMYSAMFAHFIEKAKHVASGSSFETKGDFIFQPTKYSRMQPPAFLFSRRVQKDLRSQLFFRDRCIRSTE